MGKPQTDPAIKNKRKVIFIPSTDGTLLEKLASLEITEAHAKPISLNWDLGSEEQNLLILKVVIFRKGYPDRWMFQTSTSGWRGFWVADSLIKGEEYVLRFHYLDIEVPFIYTGKV